MFFAATTSGSDEKKDFYLRIDPATNKKIIISTEKCGGQYRRRTTSIKSRKMTEKRRASLPAFYKLNIRASKTSRKTLLQKLGARLAKIGDELVRKARLKPESSLGGSGGDWTNDADAIALKKYGKKLAFIGDYLNTLYLEKNSLTCTGNHCTRMVESCLVLTSILIGLSHNNVIVVSASDIDALSSICSVHRANSMSRKRR